jgi:ParB family chromosome partitioning protein
MDNSKKNVHSSGPLGMLMKSGQIKSIDDRDGIDKKRDIVESSIELERRFKTQAGIEFNENELVYIDPKTCEPWKYANRLEEDMGDIQELIASIRENKQLQPALVRPHPHPHDNVEYEVIFGRRRYQACLQLNVPFLVIKKNINTVAEAISFQEAENRVRRDVSNYSNAILYKRLIEDNVFKNEKEISEKLGISLSRLYDIMAYSKIPNDIVNQLPSIHTLSNNLALKIVSLLKQFPKKRQEMELIASEIGKTITSPTNLEIRLLSDKKDKKRQLLEKPRIYKSDIGDKLFTLKTNQRGALCLELNRKTLPFLDYEKLCKFLKSYLEKEQIDCEKIVE